MARPNEIPANDLRPYVRAAFIAVAIIAGAIAAGMVPSPLPRFLTNADFSNYWMAARLTLDGKAIDLFSGQDIYFAHLREAFGPAYDWHNWSYPPHYLLLITLLGLLDYLPAAVVFIALTFLLFLHAASIACKTKDRLSWIFIGTFVVLNSMAIQNGFLTAALVLYGLSLRDKRPILSGIAIGLLTIKPQLGILFPILLLFEGRWRVIGAAVATIVVLVGTSVLTFGYQTWVGYVVSNIPYQNGVMMRFTGTFVSMMPSTLATLRSMGIDANIARIFQIIIAVAAIGVYLWSLRSLKTAEARAASTVIATFLISPYALDYDLGALSVYAAAAYGAARQAEADGLAPSPLIRFSLMALALLPIFVLPLGTAGAPISPLIIAAGWAGMIRIYRPSALDGNIGLSPRMAQQSSG